VGERLVGERLVGERLVGERLGGRDRWVAMIPDSTGAHLACITLLIAVFLLLTPPSTATAEPDYSKDPVVFVHGYFLSEFGSWSWLKSRLVEEGWPEDYLYSFKFDNVFGCNPKHGQELETVVNKALAETGATKVDIVCHSMGCLDSRYFIKFMCGYQKVRDYVSIAGAHQGTIIACLDPISCGADQMCVQSYEDAWMQNDFLMALNWCDITPGKDIKYTSIWSNLDEIIVPQENSILEGAVNHKLESLAEHALILANEETATWVISGLDGGGTNNNLPTSSPPCVTVCEEPIDPVDSVEQVEVADIISDGWPDLDVHDSQIMEIPTPFDLPDPSDGAATDLPGTGLPDKTGRVPDIAPLEMDQDHSRTQTDTPGGSKESPPLHLLPGPKDSGCGAAPAPSKGILLLLLAVLCLLKTGRKNQFTHHE
jgi:triacylglycerol lipase